MDDKHYSRRDFLAMAGVGGLVFASSLPGCASTGASAGAGYGDFSFVQLTDIHWGYGNPKVNPDTRGTLMRALAAVNALEQKPDFVVFTGDLTQTTDDPKVRRQRLLFVGIDLHEFHIGVFARHFLEHGRKAAAGAAPGGPEVGHDDVVAADRGVELFGGEIGDGHRSS